MAKYNVHAGHCPQGKGAYGATGLLKESVEDRLIKDEVIKLLKTEGHTVYDCTCETSETQSGCLKKIVRKCNKHSVDLDISIHLNSGRSDKKGDGKIGGFETWTTANTGIKKEVSERIRKKMKALGFTDRGSKTTSGLYVLNHTNSKAILLEVCFVDDKDDYNLYKKVGYKKVAQAIVEGILNKSINTSTTSKTIKAGSSVKIKSGAKYGGAANGKTVGDAYIGKKYTVTKVQKNNGQQEALIKQLNSWVPTKYLTVF